MSMGSNVSFRIKRFRNLANFLTFLAFIKLGEEYAHALTAAAQRGMLGQARKTTRSQFRTRGY